MILLHQHTPDAIDDWEMCALVGMGTDPLYLYLVASTKPNVKDPITYWVSQKHMGLVPPTFSQMCIDYLGCPSELDNPTALLPLTKISLL